MINKYRIAVFAFMGAFLLTLSLPAQAQSQSTVNFEFWPGATYDPVIPTVEDVLGYKAGERITWPYNVERYFRALEQAAPDRIKVMEYARTWEGRPLIYAIITNADNHARLDDIKADIQRLADPRALSAREADELTRTLPGTTWLSYAVHGNEISSTDAAMMTAYHLLAATNDARVPDIMDNTIVFIDPMQNPDGRARFVHNFEQAEGLEADGDQLAAERNEPWPRGRTNHYHFDLNRDWLTHTQPETKGKIAVVKEWYPLAFVDAHEMGSNSTYFFGPEAVPYNPHLAPDQLKNLTSFGLNNARWFDEFGIDYFTREVYDAFYPGYGASWPSYFGAIAMTYEQASARGLKARRDDGSEFHFRETVRNHFVTSLSTAEVVAKNKESLYRDFYDYRRSAIEEGGSGDVRAYIIPGGAAQGQKQGMADRLAGLLKDHGIEIYRATRDFRAGGNSYEAGSYVINAAQPAKRLVRVLLDAQVPMDDAFIQEQEARRQRNLPDQIYDVTAWSLPLMFNVDVKTSSRGVPINAGFEAVDHDGVIPARIENSDAKVAYLVPWGSVNAGRLLSRALRGGVRVKSSDKPFTHGGRQYPGGSLIIKVSENGPDLADKLASYAHDTGAEVVGVDDSWVTVGPSFGSRNVVEMLPPKIAIAWGEGASTYAAGNTRFVIEQQLDYPVTPIRMSDLARADLRRYQVLILPNGGWGAGYSASLGTRGAQNLKDWVNAGGTLILMGSAMQYAADPEVDLISVRRELAVGTEEKANAEENKTVAGSHIGDAVQYADAINGVGESPDSVAGVLVRGIVDREHWLGAGVDDTLNVLIRGSEIYTPIRISEGHNVVRFADAENLLASGYMWEENRAQLAYKPFLISEARGRGQVIGFTQDPTVRAYLEGLNILILNAVFRGSAHSTPVR